MTDSDLNPPLMPDTASTRRIVLEHKTGQLAGISQILGTTDEAPKPLPTICEGVRRPDGTTISTSLVRAKRGAVYYTELAPVPGLGRFDKAQR